MVYATDVPYDVDSYKANGGTELNETADDFKESGYLPLDYVIKVDGTETGLTIKSNIEKALLSAKKTEKYNSVVNTFLNGKEVKLQKFDKIVKQIYEGK